MSANETNLEKLRVKYGNFQVINKNELLLENGKKYLLIQQENKVVDYYHIRLMLFLGMENSYIQRVVTVVF